MISLRVRVKKVISLISRENKWEITRLFVDERMSTQTWGESKWHLCLYKRFSKKWEFKRCSKKSREDQTSINQSITTVKKPHGDKSKMHHKEAHPYTLRWYHDGWSGEDCRPRQETWGSLWSRAEHSETTGCCSAGLCKCQGVCALINTRLNVRSCGPHRHEEQEKKKEMSTSTEMNIHYTYRVVRVQKSYRLDQGSPPADFLLFQRRYMHAKRGVQRERM